MTQSDTASEVQTHSGVVWYRNIRILRVVSQVAAVLGVLGLLLWLFNNLITNLDRQNINTSFDFLARPTQFAIPFDEGFDPRSDVWHMVLVGIKNTFLAGLGGILIASSVGLIVGISRLSSNWLVARLATLYVETFRNIPPLVIIIFIGFAVFTFGPFPNLSEATRITAFGSDHNLLMLSDTIWGVPSLVLGSRVAIFWSTVLAGVVLSYFVARWRVKVNEMTGRPHHRGRWVAGVLILSVVVAALVAGDNIGISWPTLSDNGRRIEGGFILNFGFISVTLALGLYTASHIAEIIRGSILAVPRGQTEAANSVALTAFQRYRYVVLPQALRIALPPTINQYLNLVKNTSLGVAVAYAEITALTKTSIGNGRPAPQSIAILMAVYLAFSLTISFALNIYNRRIQTVER